MIIRKYLGPTFVIFALALPNAIFLFELAHQAPNTIGWIAGPLVTLRQTLFVVGCTGILISAALATYRFALARRTLHLLLFFILLDVFYRLAYSGPVSPGLLHAVPETSQRESLELLAGHPALTFFLSGVGLVGICALVQSWRLDLRFSTRRCIQAGAISTLMIVTSLAIAIFPTREHKVSAAVVREMRGIFPLDIAISFGAVAIDGFQARRNAAVRAAFAFSNPHLVAAAERRSGAEVYVIVVGETSRRRNWSLFGYARRTNPRLEEISDNLVLFNRMTSNATNTILSLPLALTRAAPAARDAERSEKSIVTLLRQAGFGTYWISNQERPALNTSPISQIALEADHVSFPDDRSQSGSADRFDSNLITRLDETLAQLPDEAKAVIFLHMEGSHFSYRQRYPQDFAVFPDGHDPPRALPDRQMQLVDDYDNSILFTDHNLRKAIDGLTRCRCKAGLIFFSDHGERLFDNGLTDSDFGHGFPDIARQEIEVPFLVWLSSEYQSANPSVLTRLRENAKSAAQLHNLFETIVDMTGVDFDNRTATLSLFSNQWRPPANLQVLDLDEDIVTLPVEGITTLASEAGLAHGDGSASGTPGQAGHARYARSARRRP
jgi:glucan phosphoethanolaminetransferase (alkaline phosphatase superfamily)